jgi:hypothetical protein
MATVTASGVEMVRVGHLGRSGITPFGIERNYDPRELLSKVEALKFQGFSFRQGCSFFVGNS